MAIGERSLGKGLPTPALLAETAAAVATLRSGRPRYQLAMFWRTFPWLLSKLLFGALVPRRTQASLRA